MSPENLRKFVGWIGFYVLFPLIVYPAAVLMAWLNDLPVTLQDLLGKGDLLFMVVVLLATTVDFAVIDFRLTPQSHTQAQWVDYLSFVVTILLLVFYTMIYGYVIASRLPGMTEMRNPGFVSLFSGLSLLVVTGFCGLQYFFLLRRGRI